MPDIITSKPVLSTIFKPVAGGYVYCAPDRAFGPLRCYLVNETQKAEITALMMPRRPILWQLTLWLVFALLVVGTALLVWALTGHDNPTVTDNTVIVVMAVVEAVVGLTLLRAWKLRRLRPVLAKLPPTDERITRSDILEAMKRNAPTDRQLLVQGATGIAAAVAFLFNFIVQMTVGHGSLVLALLSIAGAIAFGFVSAMGFMRLRSRSKERA